MYKRDLAAAQQAEAAASEARLLESTNHSFVLKLGPLGPGVIDDIADWGFGFRGSDPRSVPVYGSYGTNKVIPSIG